MNDYNRNGDYCDYGFDPIGNQLVSEFYKINPDFNIIENLLKQISDINIANKESEESILSESILGYPWSYIDDDDEDFYSEDFDNYKEDYTMTFKDRKSEKFDGRNIPGTIKLFLEYGFDVNAKNGLLGGRCLINPFMNITLR